ncbi:MAG TPA: hypothetical protein VI358_18155 [Pseudolabrys sp.]
MSDETEPFIPPHKASAHITHNQHKAYYQDIEEYATECKWVSDESRAEAIATNECWELQWYPETPIGFHRIAAAKWSDIVIHLKEKADDYK